MCIPPLTNRFKENITSTSSCRFTASAAITDWAFTVSEICPNSAGTIGKYTDLASPAFTLCKERKLSETPKVI